MRKENTLVTDKDLLSAVASELYDIAPNGTVRNIETIMNKFLKFIRTKLEFDISWGTYILYMSEDEIKKLIDDALMSIDEFKQLNLTQDEYDSGLRDPDSDDRKRFEFVSTYDSFDKNYWRRDFIDLDAVIINIKNRFFLNKDNDCDCFGCIHECEKDTCELCNKCICNENIKNNFESHIQTKGQYTIACSSNCPKGKYICCDQCDEDDNCKHRCDSHFNSCENVYQKDTEYQQHKCPDNKVICDTMCYKARNCKYRMNLCMIQ